MKFRPLQDKILVLPEARIKSDVIQVMDNEADSRGTVVAVGSGQKYDNGKQDPMPLKVGDKVFFGTYGKSSANDYLRYSEYFEDDVRYLLMSWKDVAFVEET